MHATVASSVRCTHTHISPCDDYVDKGIYQEPEERRHRPFGNQFGHCGLLLLALTALLTRNTSSCCTNDNVFKKYFIYRLAMLSPYVQRPLCIMHYIHPQAMLSPCV